MSTFPGTLIPTGLGSCDRTISLIDDYFTPRILTWRMICIYDEPASYDPDTNIWHVTYGNWLDGNWQIRKNGCDVVPLSVDLVDGSFDLGPTELGPDGIPLDQVEAMYQWDYFPYEVLEGLMRSALSVINTAAFGPPTNFKLCDTPQPPEYWDGVIIDLAYAMAMERILLDYNLWKWRLVYAIGPNEIYGGAGGGDLASVIETLKRNAEERANKTLENEKFKVGNYLAKPTAAYWASIQGVGGRGWGTACGPPFTSGRLRGWKPTSFI